MSVTPLTTVREANESDLQALVTLGCRFIRESSYRDHIRVDEAQLERLACGLIDSPDACILILERDGESIGALGVMVFRHPVSGEHVASESFWWVHPEARGRGLLLLRSAERWAREHGAQSLCLSAPDARVARCYERLGYRYIESSFERSL